ncbi:hypothetical protein AB0F81_50530, partial [Actinoplanes sp. NPDC024001]
CSTQSSVPTSPDSWASRSRSLRNRRICSCDAARDEATESARRAGAEVTAARAELAAVVAERDGLRRTVEDLERAARDRADLERRLVAARAEADAAQERAAQLTSQVSDLASALASLGSARPAAPTQPAPTGGS